MLDDKRNLDKSEKEHFERNLETNKDTINMIIE